MYAEKINKLLNEVGKDVHRDVLSDFVKNQIKAFPDYINAVIMMSTEIKIAGIRYSDDIAEYQNVVKNADRTRRRYHIALVDAINGLNRISAKYSMEPFVTGCINGIEYGRGIEFNGEHDCRKFAAGVAIDLVNEIYAKETNLQLTRNGDWETEIGNATLPDITAHFNFDDVR